MKMRISKSIVITAMAVMAVFLAIALFEGYKFRSTQVEAAQYAITKISETSEVVSHLRYNWDEMSERERLEDIYRIESMIESTDAVLSIMQLNTPITYRYKATFRIFRDQAFDQDQEDVIVFLDKLLNDFRSVESYAAENNVIPMSQKQFDDDLNELLTAMEIINKSEPWESVSGGLD
ncbi:hypothetical protein EZV73_09620 [Acidaminobacter sp. JC074]|uniref:hypothetical protein n=1 Tax=Acidaminobacter sp. JC074 TaxID=2530199 RepID=UPI001F0D85D6|nr:hypothetical protein [Acidaminobacter sp. JC074]MCH4887832.1 hypothetical protein [Acidaminobacter sp. JC074]